MKDAFPSAIVLLNDQNEAWSATCLLRKTLTHALSEVSLLTEEEEEQSIERTKQTKLCLCLGVDTEFTQSETGLTADPNLSLKFKSPMQQQRLSRVELSLAAVDDTIDAVAELKCHGEVHCIVGVDKEREEAGLAGSGHASQGSSLAFLAQENTRLAPQWLCAQVSTTSAASFFQRSAVHSP